MTVYSPSFYPPLKSVFYFSFFLLFSTALGQPLKKSFRDFSIVVLNEQSNPAAGATVSMLKSGVVFKTVITGNNGVARFDNIATGNYSFSITFVGYAPQILENIAFPSAVNTATITLQPAGKVLNTVSVTSRKPAIEQQQGKVVLNIDASVTNSGTTVLEVLEKSPGVTVDRNGGISLQGKAGVLVTINDKPTYLSAADLNNLLSSMSSSQVDQIELIANPTAKYDASGNAGVINIKTKKNRARGFNGTFTVSAGEGVYPKTGDNLALNYRSGKFNTFSTTTSTWFNILPIYML